MLLIAVGMIAPSTPAVAAPEAALIPGLTDRLVITYSSPLRGPLPAGVQEILSDGRRVVVDLGRLATFADLVRFRGPSVVDVRPDLRMQIALAPSDPNFASQWDMSDAGAGTADYSVRTPGAWDITTGSSDLVIAVLDTGITTHSEFVDRTVAGYDFVSDARVGNDGNGRDNNPSDPGDWITLSEASSGFFAAWGCEPSSSSWHGTHVAGTIGARGNNGAGIAGINWSSKIQPIRVLGKCGGYTSDISAAIRWAAGGSVVGVPNNATPARIISLSLGGPGACEPIMQDAISYARGQGSIVVVAAGNENSSAALYSPANCEGVLTVAATGRDGKRAPYSNFGASVDVAAPGGALGRDSGIYSTFNSGTFGPSSQSYASYQGTSMATPHVAGVLSLLLSIDPTLTESEVLELLASTSTPFPVDSNPNPCSTLGTCGVGIVNATALVAAVAPERSDQTINFPEQADRFVGSAPFDPGATTSSELAVTYSVSNTAVCTTNGTLITIRRDGTCTITASQAGSMLFRAAPSVARDVVFRPSIKPSISADPLVSMSPVVGTPLTMSSGAWTGSPSPNISRQWYLCSKPGSALTSSRAPSGCRAIVGENGDSYTPLNSDEGKFLRVGETAMNFAGSVTRFSATSQAVMIPPTAPLLLISPSLPAVVRTGSTVTARPGSFSGSKPLNYAYAWFECPSPVSSSLSLVEGCSLIIGANAAKLKVPVSLRGKYVGVRVTATNSFGSITMHSASSGPVR